MPIPSTVCLSHFRKVSPGKPLPLRPIVLTAAVGFWGTRLASFLLYRIIQSPQDKRFDDFFPKPGELPVKLAGFWAVQATWGFVCLLPVTLACRRAAAVAPVGPAFYAAMSAFACGFLCEAIADHQKMNFKAASDANKERWCDVGLWQYSRHPNYFGEMVVWWSLWAAAGRAVPRWSVASPLMVCGLLLFVSGVPLIEKKYDAKYAKNAEYQRYKSSTNLIVPWPPTRSPQ
mmetsp:Transcript_57400/g.138661  ORF Transcript_57400/g.138661 Transcript_57400/m.138661 type:complete len:231 (-) Transcript_57400:1277-1969(-)